MTSRCFVCYKRTVLLLKDFCLILEEKTGCFFHLLFDRNVRQRLLLRSLLKNYRQIRHTMFDAWKSIEKIRENKCLSYNTYNFYYVFPNLFKYCDYLQKKNKTANLARSRNWRDLAVLLFINSRDLAWAPNSRDLHSLIASHMLSRLRSKQTS